MTYKEDLINHYKSIWGGETVEKRFPYGPIHQLPEDFRILVFPPAEKLSRWVYAKCCMSQPEDERRIELHMFSPYESMEIEEILTATAHYHRTAARLDWSHTMYFGKGWLDNSECEYGIVSLPYIDGPNPEIAPIRGDVFFLWLLPITKAEREYKIEHGIEALEQKFGKAQINYLDQHRASVV